MSEGAPQSAHEKGVLMSRGWRARGAVVGLGMLAPLALMAAPSSAARRERQANAKLCSTGGFAGVLLAQDGSTFKNGGKCSSYAAKGGQLVGLDASAEPTGSGFINETCTGFGLKPTAFFAFDGCGAVYTSGTVVIQLGTVAADGTMSISDVATCHSDDEVAYLVLQAQTAEGALVRRTFPAPSGC
jgi:hypothetical protein